MQASKSSFLDHVRWLRHAVMARGADLLIAGDTLQALVRHGRRHWVLLPRFLTGEVGSFRVPPLETTIETFGGWLPYDVKRWPLATNRVLLKRFAAENGLPVAPFSNDRLDSPTGVIIREPTGGVATKGPIRLAAERPLESSLGEYYEQYIPGEHLQAWFWNGEAICAEIVACPSVEGDGIATLRELILRRASYWRPLSDGERSTLLAGCEEVLRFHGCSLMTVIPKGVVQLVAIEPIAVLMHPSDRRIFDLLSAPDQTWLTLLRAAGRLLASAIPESIRPDTLFTVDAVLDAQQRIWFSQVDDRPLVHPAVYPSMITSLLETRPGTAAGTDDTIEPQQPAEPRAGEEE